MLSFSVEGPGSGIQLDRQAATRASATIGILGNILGSLRDEMIEAIDSPTIEGVPLLTIEVRADEARFAPSESARLSEWTHKTLSNDLFNYLLACAILPDPDELFSRLHAGSALAGLHRATSRTQ